MVRDTETDQNGTKLQWIDYEYDPLGNPVLQKQTDADGSSFEIKNEYEYNVYGDIIKSQCYRSGKKSESAEYEYDDAGRVTSEKTFKADGNIKSWCEYQYDASGYRIKKLSHTEEGGIFQITTYDNDSDGNVVVETKVDSEGEIVEMYQYVLYY